MADTGGPNSTGSVQYLYLPTANGAMPIAAVINGNLYAIHSDHLNTPRRIDNASGQTVWQWAYSAFGDSKPTTAHNRFANLDITPNPGTTGISELDFNLRYPGQYFDKESGLFYNYFRSLSPTTGRYTQSDPIGLDGGWNRLGYVDADPLSFVDPTGLDRWGSYGYGRYIPATNPAPTFWEKLNFPETPEQQALGENIALAFCGGGMAGVTKVGNLIKARNAPPLRLPEAEGRPHSIIEGPGVDGQYTTYRPDGTWLQYRGSGKDHGPIPRPNVKEQTPNVTPDGRVFYGTQVRPPLPAETPK